MQYDVHIVGRKSQVRLMMISNQATPWRLANKVNRREIMIEKNPTKVECV
jgi:hypothetical protein